MKMDYQNKITKYVSCIKIINETIKATMVNPIMQLMTFMKTQSIQFGNTSKIKWWRKIFEIISAERRTNEPEETVRTTYLVQYMPNILEHDAYRIYSVQYIQDIQNPLNTHAYACACIQYIYIFKSNLVQFIFLTF